MRPVVLAGPEGYAAVDDSGSEGLLGALRKSVAAAAPVEEFVRTVLSDGLVRLPGFALVAIEASRVRVIVRPPFSVVVERVGGEVVVVAEAETLTWIERLVPGAEGLRFVRFREGAGTDEPETLLLVSLATPLRTSGPLPPLPNSAEPAAPRPSLFPPLRPPAPVGPQVPNQNDVTPPAAGEPPASAVEPRPGAALVPPPVATPSPSLPEPPGPAAEAGRDELEVSGVASDPVPGPIPNEMAAAGEAPAEQAPDRTISQAPLPEHQPFAPPAAGLPEATHATIAPDLSVQRDGSGEPPLASPTGAPDQDRYFLRNMLDATEFRDPDAAAVKVPTAEFGEGTGGPEGGNTHRPAALIDVVPAPGPSAQRPPLPPNLQRGDHDGHTVAVARVPRSPSPPSGLRPPVVSAQSPVVQAVHCGQRHPNPPHADRCRVCGQPIADRQVRSVPRPSLGLLRLDSGQVVDLSRSVILGRNPKAPAERSAEVFHLVALPSPTQSISRSHVEVMIEGWTVSLFDLASRNGTFVALPGQPKVRVRANSPFLLVPGAAVDLGGETTFRYEGAGLA